MVETFIPKSKEEALRLLKERKCIILAGGTNLMVKTKKWSGGVTDFESDILLIKHLQELKSIKTNKKYISIGAACTFTELQESIELPKYFSEVILSMATLTIRNVATIGGNICNVSTEGELLPLLYALDAYLIIENLNGIREIKITDFILGPGKRELKEDELLSEIRIPINSFNLYYYKKVGTKKNPAPSKASFIGLYILEGERILDLRMAFGAAGSRVIRSRELEDSIKGINKEELEIILKDIDKEYIKIIEPIDDEKSTAEYSKGVCLNLMREFLESIYKI